MRGERRGALALFKPVDGGRLMGDPGVFGVLWQCLPMLTTGRHAEPITFRLKKVNLVSNAAA